MAITLKIINNVVLDSQGVQKIAKQGATTDLTTDAYSVTSPAIVGTDHQRTGSIATATVNTIYNAANDFPATWLYGHFWADQDVYLQLIGTATNFTVKVLKQVPFAFGYGKLLAAANQTLITGGAEPTMENIQKVVVGNYSGVTANYTLLLAL